MPEKPSITLPGTVEKIINPPLPGEREKAQINISRGGGSSLQEIRIENNLTDENGNEMKLKVGAKMEVTVEANPSGIIPKPVTFLLAECGPVGHYSGPGSNSDLCPESLSRD